MNPPTENNPPADLEKPIRTDLWNKCDTCGKIIAYADIQSGNAVHRMVTPDSDLSCEEFETLCVDHSLPNTLECNTPVSPEHGRVMVPKDTSAKTIQKLPPIRRLSIPEYAVALAHVASLRSEDPYRKVGAVALDANNRVIGTAYNGLAPGYNAPKNFWDDRDARQKFMLHAEINLCSLFRREEAKIVATTTMPCTACMQTLCAHGIKEVYYTEDYPNSNAPEIASHYKIHLEKIPHPVIS